MKQFIILLLTMSGSFGSLCLASPLVGDIAPSIRLPFLDGSNLDIAKSNTEFTIVEFSAYSCSSCRAGIPNLKALSQRLEGRATVRLVMPDSKRKCKLFLEQLGVDFLTGYDLDFIAFDAYGVQSTPHIFVINQDQRIIYTHKIEPLDEETANHIYDLIAG